MVILKWIGIIVGSIVIAITVFAYFHIQKADNLIHRSMKIEPVRLDIREDSIALQIGKKWVTSLCVECHGPDLGGQTFIEDPMIGKLYAPNLTRGKGGAAYLKDKHWLGALRHGISATGRPLLVMPSMEYTSMRKEDIEGIIAYMKTIPPVDRINDQTYFKPLAKFLLSVGAFGELFGVDVIDHAAPVPENRSNETPVERGEYLSVITGCQGCHGKSLNGKYTGDPYSPIASNLTPAGHLKQWTYEDFASFIETGITKEGNTVNNRYMPWQAYSRLPQSELKAIYAYLKSLEPIEMPTKYLFIK